MMHFALYSFNASISHRLKDTWIGINRGCCDIFLPPWNIQYHIHSCYSDVYTSYDLQIKKIDQ